ncbi:acyl-CoA dehydrogenase family protein [Mycobacteroides abscessus]|uniref:acyl-CoA dehydrogenase family protein n=1 Tax=Mycobacteroides abscessus TaxID=36809 RepID=UPI000C25B300|nr:acyl-CoA dehydrogenase family protein [Mycobacteroides abscessus]
MTNTLTPRDEKKAAKSKSLAKHETGVGLQKHKRGAIDILIAVLTPIAGSELLDKYNLRGAFNKGIFESTKGLFTTLGVANRTFKKVTGSKGGPKRLDKANADYFDLNPEDEQKMIADTVKEFAVEVIRPAAYESDKNKTYPADLLGKVAELGVTAINIPEDFDGIASRRSTVTNSLVAEALSYGDMGLALPILAPSGVASALTNWGSADQQATYLKEFAGENVPQASVVIAEPQALFDPFSLKTTATRTPSGFRLNGTKSLVPAAAQAELFIVAANYNGRPTLFIVESGTEGITVEEDPSMGIRGAALGRLNLNNVAVPAANILGEEEGSDTALATYSEAVALARLGWASLAVGTGQAVLDYVIPYVKQREAFGEPIARRQAVAFMCANIAIELDGLRLVTLRGASRAEQGLPFIREAALARKLATDKGMQIGLDGVQLLGGHGFTKEHPVERWYRNLRAIGVAEGVVVL